MWMKYEKYKSRGFNQIVLVGKNIIISYLMVVVIQLSSRRLNDEICVYSALTIIIISIVALKQNNHDQITNNLIQKSINHLTNAASFICG